ncbi:hypothetical protein RSAG8_05134, partial [Rhizoctonia solani AG-8 WAC10335]
MIEQLHSAGDQLRAAWDNYFQAYSFIQSCQAPSTKTPHVSGFSAKFSHQLDTELAFISSYESKIQELKVAITRARNYLSGLATINSLPPEILTRVFQFVRAQHCDLHKLPSDKKHYPRYPDDLTHVCSLWRQIAISCCSLWSHIDLSPYDPCYGGLLARAGTYNPKSLSYLQVVKIFPDREGSGACPSSILRLITLVQDLSVCPLVALTHRKTSPSWNGKNSLHVQG